MDGGWVRWGDGASGGNAVAGQGAEVTALGGLVLAPEPFDRFLLEEELFQTFAEQVGKTWDDVLALNWPVAGSMAGRGELFVVAARTAERRMVGYSVVILGADLMADRMVASLIAVFALPEWPGLGLRLARAAAQEARGRGASALWLFKTRDTIYSWRLDTLARRLGGVEVSTTYEVPLT